MIPELAPYVSDPDIFANSRIQFREHLEQGSDMLVVVSRGEVPDIHAINE